MKNEINISIRKACQESWESFDKNGLNGFCVRCNKNVIDFTQQSDKEISNFLRKKPVGVCGRFNLNQLKKFPELEDKSGFNKAAIITAGIIALTQLNEVDGRHLPSSQGIINLPEINQPLENKKPCELPDLEMVFKVIGNIIIKEDSAKVAGVGVQVKGTSFGTTSDRDGNFEVLYKGFENDKITLVFSFIGFKRIEKEIQLNKRTIEIGTVALETDFALMGEVVVIQRWSPRGLWWRLKGFFY